MFLSGFFNWSHKLVNLIASIVDRLQGYRIDQCIFAAQIRLIKRRITNNDPF